MQCVCVCFFMSTFIFSKAIHWARLYTLPGHLWSPTLMFDIPGLNHDKSSISYNPGFFTPFFITCFAIIKEPDVKCGRKQLVKFNRLLIIFLSDI